MLGAGSGHGGDEYEQIVASGEQELGMSDPDGYLVVVAGPSEYRPRSRAG